jgi:hypothetical protein
MSYNHLASLDLPDTPCITIAYEHTIHLPVISAYKSIISTAEPLAMTGCVTSEVNQNLKFLEKVMLQWNLAWTCCVLHHQVAWETRHTWEAGGKDRLRLGQDSQVCHMSAWKTRTPDSTQMKDKSVESALKCNKLEPRELVSTDQYESRLPGRVFSNHFSKVTSEQYKRGTLFCDAASSQVGIHNQVCFIAEEKGTFKLKFE